MFLCYFMISEASWGQETKSKATASLLVVFFLFHWFMISNEVYLCPATVIDILLLFRTWFSIAAAVSGIVCTAVLASVSPFFFCHGNPQWYSAIVSVRLWTDALKDFERHDFARQPSSAATSASSAAAVEEASSVSKSAVGLFLAWLIKQTNSVLFHW